MLTTSVSRRTALGVLGLGSAAFLAACSSSNTNEGSSGSGSASASSTSTRSDYSGEAKFDNFDTSAGEYEPATREHPAKNAPKPIKPENMNENSVAGLYSSIVFIGAAIQYALLSGDPASIEESALSDEDKKSFLEGDFLKAIAEGKSWAADPKVTLTFVDAQPKEENGTYTWPVKFKSTPGSFTVVDGEVREETSSDTDRKVIFKGTYSDNKWSITGMDESSGSDSSATQDAQGN